MLLQGDNLNDKEIQQQILSLVKISLFIATKENLNIYNINLQLEKVLNEENSQKPKQNIRRKKYKKHSNQEQQIDFQDDLTKQLQPLLYYNQKIIDDIFNQQFEEEQLKWKINNQGVPYNKDVQVLGWYQNFNGQQQIYNLSEYDTYQYDFTPKLKQFLQLDIEQEQNTEIKQQQEIQNEQILNCVLPQNKYNIFYKNQQGQIKYEETQIKTNNLPLYQLIKVNEQQELQQDINQVVFKNFEQEKLIYILHLQKSQLDIKQMQQNLQNLISFTIETSIQSQYFSNSNKIYIQYKNQNLSLKSENLLALLNYSYVLSKSSQNQDLKLTLSQQFIKQLEQSENYIKITLNQMKLKNVDLQQILTSKKFFLQQINDKIQQQQNSELFIQYDQQINLILGEIKNIFQIQSEIQKFQSEIQKIFNLMKQIDKKEFNFCLKTFKFE